MLKLTTAAYLFLAAVQAGHSSSSSSSSDSSSSSSSTSHSSSSAYDSSSNSTSSSSSSSSYSWTSDNNTSLTYRHAKQANWCHSNFVVVTPPVGWEKAEEVCRLNGYELAKINQKNIHAALKMMRVAKYKAAWIKSYMGHGCDKDAAVVLRPGYTKLIKVGGGYDKKNARKGCHPRKPKTVKKWYPTTVKIMQKLKASKCCKTYPVLCQSKKPCPNTESTFLDKARPKQCHRKEKSQICGISKSGDRICKNVCPIYETSTGSSSSSSSSTMVEVKVSKKHGGKCQKKSARRHHHRHPRKQQQQQQKKEQPKEKYDYDYSSETDTSQSTSSFDYNQQQQQPKQKYGQRKQLPSGKKQGGKKN